MTFIRPVLAGPFRSLPGADATERPQEKLYYPWKKIIGIWSFLSLNAFGHSPRVDVQVLNRVITRTQGL